MLSGCHFQKERIGPGHAFRLSSAALSLGYRIGAAPSPDQRICSPRSRAITAHFGAQSPQPRPVRVLLPVCSGRTVGTASPRGNANSPGQSEQGDASSGSRRTESQEGRKGKARQGDSALSGMLPGRRAPLPDGSSARDTKPPPQPCPSPAAAGTRSAAAAGNKCSPQAGRELPPARESRRTHPPVSAPESTHSSSPPGCFSMAGLGAPRPPCRPLGAALPPVPPAVCGRESRDNESSGSRSESTESSESGESSGRSAGPAPAPRRGRRRPPRPLLPASPARGQSRQPRRDTAGRGCRLRNYVSSFAVALQCFLD